MPRVASKPPKERNTKPRDAVRKKPTTPKHAKLIKKTDTGIRIRLDRNRRNNTLSPTPDEIETALNENAEEGIFVDFWEYVENGKGVNVQRTELVQYFYVLLRFVHRWLKVRLWVPWIPLECFHSGVTFSPKLRSVELGAPREFDIQAALRTISVCWAPAGDLYGQRTTECSPGSPLRHFFVRQATCDTVLSRREDSMAMIGEHLSYRFLVRIVLECKMTPEECIGVLQRGQQTLEWCELTNITKPRDCLSVACGKMKSKSSKRNIHRIQCRRLLTLRLANNFDDHCEFDDPLSEKHCLHRILDYLQAPNLISLGIENDDAFKESALLEFIEESRCSILSLDFFMVRLTPGGLLALLRACPQLRAFKLFGDEEMGDPQGFSKGICDMMTNRPPYSDEEEEEILCPELEMLAINVAALLDLNDGQITFMITSRIDKTPLRLAWIITDRTKDPLKLKSKDEATCNQLKNRTDWDKKWKTFEKLILEHFGDDVTFNLEPNGGPLTEWQGELARVLEVGLRELAELPGHTMAKESVRCANYRYATQELFDTITQNASSGCLEERSPNKAVNTECGLTFGAEMRAEEVAEDIDMDETPGHSYDWEEAEMHPSSSTPTDMDMDMNMNDGYLKYSVGGGLQFEERNSLVANDEDGWIAGSGYYPGLEMSGIGEGDPSWEPVWQNISSIVGSFNDRLLHPSFYN